MAGQLILIANPGSASRKYALYQGDVPRAELHFEWEAAKIICTVHHSSGREIASVDITRLNDAARQVIPLLHTMGLLREEERIDAIGLRVVAPSAYFLHDRIIDNEFEHRLKAVATRAPLHVSITLEELAIMRQLFAIPIVGVSDSAFHVTKPEKAWNYGLPLADADRLDIKRFGYHGLSAASVVQTLQGMDRAAGNTIICHIGSGVSVTAARDGTSVDTTMGYSPLEGVIMATRSGSIDFMAGHILKHTLGLDDDSFEAYLNNQSGLLGLGGSSDIRELLAWEAAGNAKAALALDTFTYSLQKAVGQMSAVLGGIDRLVFTGTVGERSASIRRRVLTCFEYLNLVVDEEANANCTAPTKLTDITMRAHPKPIYVVPTDESIIMARQTLRVMSH